jgi:hypothetical protein
LVRERPRVQSSLAAPLNPKENHGLSALGDLAPEAFATEQSAKPPLENGKVRKKSGEVAKVRSPCVLTAERLHSLLAYNPKTGLWVWRVTPGGRARAGAIAGSLDGCGYHAIKINRRLYLAHRLAFLYINGEWPKGEIDHVNHDRADNQWSNLREATHSQNLGNQGAYKNNRSGYKGVTWQKRDRKWQAQIQVGGKSHHLGHYDTAEAAHAAYCRAAIKHFGQFARFS